MSVGDSHKTCQENIQVMCHSKIKKNVKNLHFDFFFFTILVSNFHILTVMQNRFLFLILTLKRYFIHHGSSCAALNSCKFQFILKCCFEKKKVTITIQ